MDTNEINRRFFLSKLPLPKNKIIISTSKFLYSEKFYNFYSVIYKKYYKSYNIRHYEPFDYMPYKNKFYSYLCIHENKESYGIGKSLNKAKNNLYKAIKKKLNKPSNIWTTDMVSSSINISFKSHYLREWQESKLRSFVHCPVTNFPMKVKGV